MLVGGDHAAFQAARPILECFGGGEEKITFLGPAGSGHLVKAVNNAMLGAHLAVAGEASRRTPPPHGRLRPALDALGDGLPQTGGH